MRHDDPRPARFDARWVMHAMLTAVLAWVSIRLWWPDDTFATSQAFRTMAWLASEDRWAAILWVAAMVGLVGLVTPSRPLILFSIGIVATAHGILAGCLVLSGGALLPGVLFILAVGGYYLLGRRAYAGI